MYVFLVKYTKSGCGYLESERLIASFKNATNIHSPRVLNIHFLVKCTKLGCEYLEGSKSVFTVFLNRLINFSGNAFWGFP